jgi:hypothetical protein
MARTSLSVPRPWPDFLIMPNTGTDTKNYIEPFCRYEAANVGTNNMPFIGILNIVRNIILAAPFTWRFNRNNVNLQATGQPAGTQPGVQDYIQKITDFGFAEKATANDGTTSFEFKDMKNNEALASSTTTARPMSLSVFNDDGQSNLTFRLSAVPDIAYTVNIVYQKAPVPFVALTDPWAPIPDSFSDVYNNMCLGYYMDSCQDGRAPQYIARGIAGLLARAQGLSQMDKIIFASAYMNLDSQQIMNTLKAQQSVQAQGAR